MKPNNDIQEELKMLNSTLGTLPKRMPYEVPKEYFEGLYTSVSLHARQKQATPHIVPEGYFDNMPEEILERIKKELEPEKPATKQIDFSWRRISIAAAIIFILISIGIYQEPNEQPLTVAENLAQLPDEAVLAYVEDNIDEFDIELIKSSLPNTTQEVTLKEIDNTAINDYLYNME